MKEEHVLVIRRDLFDRIGAFQGARKAGPTEAAEFWRRENNFFLPRSRAENSPDFKQIIPYAVLWHEGRVLHYVRGGASGEKRLVAKGSIGIGGHINDGDESLFAFDEAAYHAAVRRELAEELEITDPWSEEIVGLLNDDSTPVGQVHLGIVHFVRLSTPRVRAREKTLCDLRFLSRPALEQALPAMETWSQILVQNWEALFPERLAEA